MASCVISRMLIATKACCTGCHSGEDPPQCSIAVPCPTCSQRVPGSASSTQVPGARRRSSTLCMLCPVVSLGSCASGRLTSPTIAAAVGNCALPGLVWGGGSTAFAATQQPDSVACSAPNRRRSIAHGAAFILRRLQDAPQRIDGMQPASMGAEARRSPNRRRPQWPDRSRTAVAMSAGARAQDAGWLTAPGCDKG